MPAFRGGWRRQGAIKIKKEKGKGKGSKGAKGQQIVLEVLANQELEERVPGKELDNVVRRDEGTSQFIIFHS